MGLKNTKRVEAYCPICKKLVPHGRALPYCSKKCQAKVEGYVKKYEDRLRKLGKL